MGFNALLEHDFSETSIIVFSNIKRKSAQIIETFHPGGNVETVENSALKYPTRKKGEGCVKSVKRSYSTFG